MTALYIAWQNPQTRGWYTVGCLGREQDSYCFRYTGGASRPGFKPFERMPDLGRAYYSRELFPLFANRLLAKGRPEYRDYLRWLNMDEDPGDPLLLLGRSGGIRATDLLEVFPQPVRDAAGWYTLEFFSHGLRHLPAESLAAANALDTGDPLVLVPEPDNPHDEQAIALHTAAGIKTGWCPRYFLPDLNRGLRENTPLSTQTARINRDAPLQLRLLCRLRLQPDFELFSGKEFEPM